MKKPNQSWISIQIQKSNEQKSRWYNSKTIYRLFMALYILTAVAAPLAFFIWPSMPWLVPFPSGPLYFFPTPSDLIPPLSVLTPFLPFLFTWMTFGFIYNNPEKQYQAEMAKETLHFQKLKKKVVSIEDKKLLAKLEDLLNKSTYPEFSLNPFKNSFSKNDVSIDTLKTLKWACKVLEKHVLAKSKSADKIAKINHKIDHTLLLLQPMARTHLVAKAAEQQLKYEAECQKNLKAEEFVNRLKK